MGSVKLQMRIRACFFASKLERSTRSSNERLSPQDTAIIPSKVHTLSKTEFIPRTNVKKYVEKDS